MSIDGLLFAVTLVGPNGQKAFEPVKANKKEKLVKALYLEFEKRHDS
jgi:hypothetical protein